MEKKAQLAGKPADAPVVENHSAPEIYVSQILACDIEWGGVIKLTFVSNHQDPNGHKQAVNLRLVMSIGATENMLDFVGRWLAGVKATTAPVPAGTPMQ